MGEAGGSSESEFSNERSSTSALRPRMARGSGARLDRKEDSYSSSGKENMLESRETDYYHITDNPVLLLYIVQNKNIGGGFCYLWTDPDRDVVMHLRSNTI